MAGLPAGEWFVVVSLFSSAALLVVAAQAGFLDGPRVLANMAVDSWMPHRLAQLSDRLVTQNGILLMGTASLGALLYTGGSTGTLVVMYSINVFLTFSLTEIGMARHYLRERRTEPRWRSQLAIHGTGLVLCVGILAITSYEKFADGGWVTLAITCATVAVAFAIRRSYDRTERQLARLDDLLLTLPEPAAAPARDVRPDRALPTAVICVATYSGFGLHQVLSIEKLFPGHFRNFVFVSAAVLDSGSFNGAAEVEALERDTARMLQRYVGWARARGWHAEAWTATGAECVEMTETLCEQVSRQFPRAIFFMGKLIFERKRLLHALLHNETAHAIQRRLQFKGLQAIVLPVRVLETTA